MARLLGIGRRVARIGLVEIARSGDDGASSVAQHPVHLVIEARVSSFHLVEKVLHV